jgi:hypothetical protein
LFERGEIVDQLQETISDDSAARASFVPPTGERIHQVLPPKGACWYCDKGLDNVRRFCGKSCAAAFAEEQR